MQSLKGAILKVGVPLLAAGAVSATDIDMSTAIAPLVDLMEALPTILTTLIPIVMVLVVVVSVVAVGKMVVHIFSRIGGAIKF